MPAKKPTAMPDIAGRACPSPASGVRHRAHKLKRKTSRMKSLLRDFVSRAHANVPRGHGEGGSVRMDIGNLRIARAGHPFVEKLALGSLIRRDAHRRSSGVTAGAGAAVFN